MNIYYTLGLRQLNNIINNLEKVEEKYNTSLEIIDMLLRNNCQIKKDSVLYDIRTIELIEYNNNIIIIKSERILKKILTQLIFTIERILIIYYIGNKQLKYIFYSKK